MPFPTHFTFKNTLLNRVSEIFFHLFLVAYLNRFEKVAVSNEHLVPAARDHDLFCRSKNRTVRPSFFS